MTSDDWRMRLAMADPNDYNAELLDTAAAWLRAIQSTLGPVRNTPPPDQETVARFLSLADWGKLQPVLSDIIARRVPTSGSYGWFVQYAVRVLFNEEL